MDNEVIAYARTFLGTPYVFAGNNRLTGFDCSGYVCEVLRSFGIVAAFQDLSAQQLYDHLLKLVGSKRFASGDRFPLATIIFFRETSTSEMGHTAIVVDSVRMIEAGGGGRITTDFHKAAMVGAMVRERPISFRRDLVAGILPPYPNVNVS